MIVVWSLPPKCRPISGKDDVGQLPAEIHGDLSGMHECLASAPRLQIADLHVELGPDHFLNVLDRHDLLLLADEVTKDFLAISSVIICPVSDA